MSETAPASSGAMESVSALGLMVGGAAGLLLSALALGFGLPVGYISWWIWLLPLWAVVALPLGWRIRRRSAPSKLRTAGRIWLISAAIPLVAVLGFGKPVQKVMLEKQAEKSAEKKGE